MFLLTNVNFFVKVFCVIMFSVCPCKKIIKFGVRPSNFYGVTLNEVKLSNIDPVQYSI
jgi:hypothetical protein